MRKNNSNLLTQSSVMFNKSEAQYKPFKFSPLINTQQLKLDNLNLNGQIMNKIQILEINKLFRIMKLSEMSLTDLQKLIKIFQISAKYYSESQLRKKNVVESKYENLLSFQQKLDHLQQIKSQHINKKKEFELQIMKIQLELEEIETESEQIVYVKCHICGRKQIEKNINNHIAKHKQQANQENLNLQNIPFQVPQKTVQNPIQDLRQSEFIQKIANILSKDIEQKLEVLQFQKPPKTPQPTTKSIQLNNLKESQNNSIIKDSIINMNQMFNNFQNLFSNFEQKQSIINITNQCESQILVSEN